MSKNGGPTWGWECCFKAFSTPEIKFWCKDTKFIINSHLAVPKVYEIWINDQFRKCALSAAQIHNLDISLDQPRRPSASSLKRKTNFFQLYRSACDRMWETRWLKTDSFVARCHRATSLMPARFLLRCPKNTLAHVNNKSCTIRQRTQPQFSEVHISNLQIGQRTLFSLWPHSDPKT